MMVVGARVLGDSVMGLVRKWSERVSESELLVGKKRGTSTSNDYHDAENSRC